MYQKEALIIQSKFEEALTMGVTSAQKRRCRRPIRILTAVLSSERKKRQCLIIKRVNIIALFMIINIGIGLAGLFLIRWATAPATNYPPGFESGFIKRPDGCNTTSDEQLVLGRNCTGAVYPASFQQYVVENSQLHQQPENIAAQVLALALPLANAFVAPLILVSSKIKRLFHKYF